jgi:hypothetical protein
MAFPLQDLSFCLQFFNTVRYIIGGEAYSLQDIENGVLRGNRKGVGQYYQYNDTIFMIL